MKIPKSRRTYSLELAFMLAVLIHLFAMFFLSIVYLNSESILSEQFVFVEFKSFTKPKIEKNDLVRKQKKLYPSKRLVNKKKSPKRFTPFVQKIIDTNIVPKFDSLKQIISLLDSINTTEEFILENPNLIALKIAIKENIEKGVVKKTKEKITEEKIRKAMLDYYKAKYPTAPYKFGERGTGNLINIPIDDLIELFE